MDLIEYYSEYFQIKYHRDFDDYFYFSISFASGMLKWDYHFFKRKKSWKENKSAFPHDLENGRLCRLSSLFLDFSFRSKSFDVPQDF